MNYSPTQIFNEYKKGVEFKSSFGAKGIYEQNKINERFYVGDQWYGAKCSNERPLVRHNIIKRIGDYKMSVLLSGPINISYSAEGIPETVGIRDKVADYKKRISAGEKISPHKLLDGEEISLVMSALNDYQKVTAERLKLGILAEKTLKNAYIGGTGIVYTYWDSTVATGLYADDTKTVAIKGDIVSEALPIENLYFGDPNIEDIQKQPYIIIATQKSAEEIYREALLYSNETCFDIDEYTADEKITVLTRLWKEYDAQGNYKIYATRVTEKVVIRDKWDIGVRIYPLAKFCWETRHNCAYGDSEVTYLIPNQIAINRMITSGVWSAMTTGMPTMVVNGDIIDGEITNDPGQIVKIYGTSDDVANAIRYVSPPDNTGNFTGIVEPLISNTLAQNGANAAALGDVNPDNTSAIIQLRNAAKLPLAMLEARYFAFLEEISRIWAEFWVMQYGRRRIKINDQSGVWYLDFDGERYKDLVINASAEISSGASFSEETTVSVLDNLLDKGAITPLQYLKRLPKGLIPNVSELIKEVENLNVDSKRDL